MKHTLEHPDRIAAEQAAYYGMTKEEHAKMIDEVARLCEEVRKIERKSAWGTFVNQWRHQMTAILIILGFALVFGLAFLGGAN